MAEPLQAGISRSRLMNTMKITPYIDSMLIIIALLFIITLLLFLNDVFPYPYGLFILLIFFIARILHIRARNSQL